MQKKIAISHGLAAVTFIIGDDAIRERFLALSGLSPQEIRGNIQDSDFLSSVLEFLVSHEPDLVAFSEITHEKPETIVKAWRTLGGGIGQEW